MMERVVSSPHGVVHFGVTQQMPNGEWLATDMVEVVLPATKVQQCATKAEAVAWLNRRAAARLMLVANEHDPTFPRPDDPVNTEAPLPEPTPIEDGVWTVAAKNEVAPQAEVEPQAEEARQEAPEPEPMKGWQLRERYQEGERYFGGADLRRANLEWDNLSGANLGCANLECADLSHANLHGVNLRYANLSNARLYETNLSGADLTEANLIGVKLTLSQIAECNLSPEELRRQLSLHGYTKGDAQ